MCHCGHHGDNGICFPVFCLWYICNNQCWSDRWQILIREPNLRGISLLFECRKSDIWEQRRVRMFVEFRSAGSAITGLCNTCPESHYGSKTDAPEWASSGPRCCLSVGACLSSRPQRPLWSVRTATTSWTTRTCVRVCWAATSPCRSAAARSGLAGGTTARCTPAPSMAQVSLKHLSSLFTNRVDSKLGCSVCQTGLDFSPAVLSWCEPKLAAHPPSFPFGGVPQKSTLEPLLFWSYMLPLGFIFHKYDIHAQCYAYDNHLYSNLVNQSPQPASFPVLQK